MAGGVLFLWRRASKAGAAAQKRLNILTVQRIVHPSADGGFEPRG
jgi:hypothetical protein